MPPSLIRGCNFCFVQETVAQQEKDLAEERKRQKEGLGEQRATLQNLEDTMHKQQVAVAQAQKAVSIPKNDNIFGASVEAATSERGLEDARGNILSVSGLVDRAVSQERSRATHQLNNYFEVLRLSSIEQTTTPCCGVKQVTITTLGSAY